MQKTIIFYDGKCALCHGFVQFVLARDRDKALFLFAPLQGQTSANMLDIEVRSGIPKTIVVREPAGKLLTHAEAILYVFYLLGGPWSAFARMLHIFPPPIRTAAYRLIAMPRYRLMGTTKESCPIVPQELKDRFLP